MELYVQVRRAVYVEGMSRREAARRQAAKDSGLQRAAVPLPVRRPLRTTGQGQRQGQSRRAGGLRAAQLHGADPSCGQLRRAQRACWSAVGADWATGCVVMMRPSASGWCGTAPPCCRCRRLPTKPARRRLPGSARCPWCATAAMTTRCRLPTATARFWCGYVHEVAIACGAEEIARHPRSYEHEDFIFNPLHYLALLERKIGALDQAAPLAGWALPEEFATLRRLLEARMGKPGKREFVQVLRLMEVFRPDDVLAGVREAMARGVIGFDAVKHLVLCRIERRPPRLDLKIYPYLPQAAVATTMAKAYQSLAGGRSTVMSDTPQVPARPSLEGAEAADLPARVRQAGPPVRRRRRRRTPATCCVWPSWR